MPPIASGQRQYLRSPLKELLQIQLDFMMDWLDFGGQRSWWSHKSLEKVLYILKLHWLVEAYNHRALILVLSLKPNT